MNDYKGIYYKNNKESKQIYYEGGAHFKYSRLYEILENLVLNRKMRIRRDKLIESREKKMKEKNKNMNQSVEKTENNINKVSAIKFNYSFI